MKSMSNTLAKKHISVNKLKRQNQGYLVLIELSDCLDF